MKIERKPITHEYVVTMTDAEYYALNLVLEAARDLQEATERLTITFQVEGAEE